MDNGAIIEIFGIAISTDVGADNVIDITHFVVIGTVIFVAVFYSLYIWKRYSYACPKCGEHFKEKRFMVSFLALTNFNERRMRCPNCDLRSWMKISKS